MSAPLAAAVQMTTGDAVSANLEQARRLLTRAREAGARVAVLPENFAFMGREERAKLAHAEPADGSGPLTSFLREEAARLGLWIVGGTLPYADPAETERVRATCLLVDGAGEVAARYDKIHLFEVNLGPEHRYREANTLAPGDTPVTADTPLGRVGLAVCYDVRFPELFRALVDQGAEWLAVPAAFTARTGVAHWELLVRARAVEEQAAVVAADQGGRHPGGRYSYGHSLIIDAWGTVRDRWERGPGLALARVDPAATAEVRRRLPALSHRRLGMPEPPTAGGV
jgi:nitrilase